MFVQWLAYFAKPEDQRLMLLEEKGGLVVLSTCSRQEIQRQNAIENVSVLIAGKATSHKFSNKHEILSPI